MTQILFSFFILFLFTGSGIFVSPSGLLVRTGSVGVSFIIWLACGLLSLLGEYIERDLNALSPLSHHPLKRCPSRPSCNGLFIGPSITCPHMFIRMFACVCVCVWHLSHHPSTCCCHLPLACCRSSPWLVANYVAPPSSLYIFPLEPRVDVDDVDVLRVIRLNRRKNTRQIKLFSSLDEPIVNHHRKIAIEMRCHAGKFLENL